MRATTPVITIVLLLAAAGCFADEPTSVPMQLSYDGPRGIADLSGWLDRPAGRHGFIRVEGSRFMHGDRPIRFWGTNLSFDASFPRPGDAAPLAERLARLGINCVRLHHMDSRSIWGDTGGHTRIDPERLARLDRLVYELKQRGIYVNINLHVSRWLDEVDGFPHREQRPRYDKGTGQLLPRLVAAQKQFARDLLTHVNPHTGSAYTDEPAVAMVEITNEDSLRRTWQSGALDRLPEPYATTYRKRWNTWLHERYGSTDRLRAAWRAGAKPLGENMLPPVRRDADDTTPRWILERGDDPTPEVRVLDGGRRIDLTIHRPGPQPWLPQLKVSGLRLRRGEPYTLTFRARARPSQSIRVNAMMDHDPWEPLGMDVEIELADAMTEHRLTFIATRDDDVARITFTDLDPGRIALTDVELRPGGVTGLRDGERLEDDSVAVMPARQRDRTATARRDFERFLFDTEQQYFLGMFRFLKDELGVNQPVSGTQLGWSPAEIQTQLDYVDAHAYWQHPRFPGRPWDMRNWYVNNLALVRHWPGPLGRLAEGRAKEGVAGKPYTVSEYNHPAPIQYRAEGFPMLAAVAARNDFSGIFSYSYIHGNDYRPRRIESFFDVAADPARLAHFPACATMFLRGDVAVADERSPDRDPIHAAFGAFTVDTARTKVFSGLVKPGEPIELGDVTLRLGPTELGWATVSMTCIDGEGFDRPGNVLIVATGRVHNTGATLRHLGDSRITLGADWGEPPVRCEVVPLTITLPVAARRLSVHALDASAEPVGEPISLEDRQGPATLNLGPPHKTIWYAAQIKP